MPLSFTLITHLPGVVVQFSVQGVWGVGGALGTAESQTDAVSQLHHRVAWLPSPSSSSSSSTSTTTGTTGGSILHLLRQTCGVVCNDIPYSFVPRPSLHNNTMYLLEPRKGQIINERDSCRVRLHSGCTSLCIYEPCCGGPTVCMYVCMYVYSKSERDLGQNEGEALRRQFPLVERGHEAQLETGQHVPSRHSNLHLPIQPTNQPQNETNTATIYCIAGSGTPPLIYRHNWDRFYVS